MEQDEKATTAEDKENLILGPGKGKTSPVPSHKIYTRYLVNPLVVDLHWQKLS